MTASPQKWRERTSGENKILSHELYTKTSVGRTLADLVHKSFVTKDGYSTRNNLKKTKHQLHKETSQVATVERHVTLLRCIAVMLCLFGAGLI